MKTTLYYAIFVLSCSALMLSCQDAEFSRSDDSKKEGSENYVPGGDTSTGNGGTGNTGGSSLDPSFTDPGGTGNPGDPDSTGNVPDGNSGGGIFGGFDPSNPFWQGASPNPYFQSFGGNGELWHIGDEGWSASTCRAKIDVRPRQGRSFNFHFRVLQPNTQIDIQLKYCGVDYVGSQAFIIDPAGMAKGTVNFDLTKEWGIFNWLTWYQKSWFQTVTLQPGWHKVQVVSVQQGSDLDNYVVGRVNLDPNKPIELGDVTEN